VTLRIFGFGDLNGGPWGAAWIPSDAAQGALLGAPAGPEASTELEGEDPGQTWQLRAGATALTLEGLGEPVRSGLDGGDRGFDQLCQVTGFLQDPSGRREVNTLGWRSAREEPLPAGRQRSLRQVAGWFDRDDGFALLSVRPDSRRGQEEDEVVAAQFGPTGAREVVDPRLSTTYAEPEQPTRASVELWIESEEDSDAQYPRRAIGEALGSPAEARVGGLALHARPFRWYGGGREGAGIYLLGRVA
jgi:hypothetical protein